jgi:hypothetical protein
MIMDVICHSIGSCPSEAHGGGWEGLGKDGQEPMLHLESIPKTVMDLNIY